MEGVELEVPPGAFETETIVSLSEGDVAEIEQALLNDPLSLIEPAFVGPAVDVQATSELKDALTLRMPFDPELLSEGASAGDVVILAVTDD